MKNYLSYGFFSSTTLKRKFLSPLFCFFMLFSVSNCDKINELCNGNDCFSFEDFEQNIKDRMEGNATGYGFVIYHGQQTNNIYVSGNRRMDVDGAQLFTLTNSMHIASISKSVTAMGLMHALDARNDVDVDELIHPFLPSGWTQGSNINSITFRELLTHNSGLRSTSSYSKCSHSELTTLIAAGITLSDKSSDSYQNVNYGMMRILIPTLNGTAPSSDSDASGYANAYVQYIQDNVLAEVSALLATKDCIPESTNPTLYYDFPHSGGAGWDGYGDLTDFSGGFGWHFSLLDLGTLIGQFAYTEDIVSSNTRDDMYSSKLGILQYSGSEGTYYWHDGGWVSGSGGLSTCYMIFPKNDVHAVIFMNSTPSPQSPQDILAESYDEAWEIL